MQPMRDILEEVIHRAEQIDSMTRVVDIRAIGRILHDLDVLDGEFLEQISGHVPALVEKLASLKEMPENARLFADGLESVLQDVDELLESAERVNATTIMLFLQGLRSFLLVAAHGNQGGNSHRLQAVQDRLTALVPLAKQWVDIGRIERTAIIDILPV